MSWLPLRRRIERRPDYPDQLARDRDHGLVRYLVARDQGPEAMAQAILRSLRERDDPVGLAGSPPSQAHPDVGTVTVVPGGLDEQTSHMDVAGLGDRAPALVLTTRMFARDQPQIGHQRARRLEAPEVVKLGDHGD